MEMTVMKEEIFYNHWFLETRGKAQHAGPHGEQGQSEDGVRRKCGQELVLWFLWEEQEKQGKEA